MDKQLYIQLTKKRLENEIEIFNILQNAQTELEKVQKELDELKDKQEE